GGGCVRVEALPSWEEAACGAAGVSLTELMSVSYSSRTVLQWSLLPLRRSVLGPSGERAFVGRTESTFTVVLTDAVLPTLSVPVRDRQSVVQGTGAGIGGRPIRAGHA